MSSASRSTLASLEAIVLAMRATVLLLSLLSFSEAIQNCIEFCQEVSNEPHRHTWRPDCECSDSDELQNKVKSNLKNIVKHEDLIFFEPAENILPVSFVDQPFILPNPIYNGNLRKKNMMQTLIKVADTKNQDVVGISSRTSLDIKENYQKRPNEKNVPIYLDIGITKIVPNISHSIDVKRINRYYDLERYLNECLDLYLFNYWRKQGTVYQNFDDIFWDATIVKKYNHFSDFDLSLIIKTICKEPIDILNKSIEDIKNSIPKKLSSNLRKKLEYTVAGGNMENIPSTTEVQHLFKSEAKLDKPKVSPEMASNILLVQSNQNIFPEITTEKYNKIYSSTVYSTNSIDKRKNLYIESTEHIENDISLSSKAFEINSNYFSNNNSTNHLSEIQSNSTESQEVGNNKLDNMLPKYIFENSGMYLINNQLSKEKNQPDNNVSENVMYLSKSRNENWIHNNTILKDTEPDDTLKALVRITNKDNQYTLSNHTVFDSFNSDSDKNLQNTEINVDAVYSNSAEKRLETTNKSENLQNTNLKSFNETIESTSAKSEMLQLDNPVESAYENLNSYTTPLANTIKNNSYIIDSMDIDKKNSLRSGKEIPLRQKIMENEINIPKNFTDELKNDTVLSFKNDVENLPNNDFVIYDDLNRQERNESLTIDNTLETESPDHENMNTNQFSVENIDIMGNIFFKFDKQEIPAQFTQNYDGKLKISIDGMTFCDKLRMNIMKSPFFSALCKCYKNTI